MAKKLAQLEKPFNNRIIGHGEERVDQLLANPLNFRLHPNNQQQALAGAIDDIGFIRSVTVNQRTGRVVDGHLRVTVALRSGVESLPVEYVDLDEAEEAQALISLDPIAAMAASDKQKLDELMRSVQSDDERVLAMINEIAEKHGIGLDTDDENSEEPDLGIIGIKKQRWSFKHGVGFLCLRAFDVDKKHEEMEWLKELKRNKTQDITDFITSEIANAIRDTFVDLSGFIVTSAPEHKTGFAKLLAQNVAAKVGVDYKELYFSAKDPDAKREIFGDRPAISCAESDKKIIWIDDTLTTGRTLESCREFVKTTFIPVVWIYDRMAGK